MTENNKIAQISTLTKWVQLCSGHNENKAFAPEDAAHHTWFTEVDESSLARYVSSQAWHDASEAQ
jgi:hypothetical protein